jgi:hypothetical protein
VLCKPFSSSFPSCDADEDDEDQKSSIAADDEDEDGEEEGNGQGGERKQLSEKQLAAQVCFFSLFNFFSSI